MFSLYITQGSQNDVTIDYVCVLHIVGNQNIFDR